MVSHIILATGQPFFGIELPFICRELDKGAFNYEFEIFLCWVPNPGPLRHNKMLYHEVGGGSYKYKITRNEGHE